MRYRSASPCAGSGAGRSHASATSAPERAAAGCSPGGYLFGVFPPARGARLHLHRLLPFPEEGMIKKRLFIILLLSLAVSPAAGRTFRVGYVSDGPHYYNQDRKSVV